MDSLSKTPVSLETAGQIVWQHLGAKRKIAHFEELTDGFFNAAYYIQLEDGLCCVLKVAPAASVRVMRYERAIMHAEVDAMRLVRSRTSMPVPQILAYDASGEILPNEFFLMEFLDGVPLNKLRPSLPAEDQAAIDRSTGAYLRQMNSLAGENFGYFAQPERRKLRWREAFDDMLIDLLADGREMQVPLPMPYNELHAFLGSHYEALDAVTTPSLVHWDLWDGNIFINPETKKITGIIDFERALWGDPLMECNFGAFGVNRAFMEGYGMMLPYDENQSARRALYNIYLYLILAIEPAFRHYPTNEVETWGREKLDQELDLLN